MEKAFPYILFKMDFCFFFMNILSQIENTLKINITPLLESPSDFVYIYLFFHIFFRLVWFRYVYTEMFIMEYP